MREHCLNELASIWYNLLVTYSDSNPGLAEAVLSVVKRYVSWIDIGLVANDRCLASVCHKYWGYAWAFECLARSAARTWIKWLGFQMLVRLAMVLSAHCAG